MEETVLVLYPGVREVFVDGTQNGTTNQPMAVETGTHTFDLGKPVDYAPPNITEQVSGTVPLDPRILRFDPI
jgi:hypothetical protein